MHTKLIRFSRYWYPTRARVYTRVAGAMLTAVFGGLLLLGFSQATALSAVQGYKTNQTNLSPGNVVAVVDASNSGGDGYVAKASQANSSKIIGVVVNPNDSALSVTSTGSQVYVATAGVANVYVSDINGVPKSGDLLAASPLEGVLMRANSGTRGGLGVALSDFPKTGLQTVNVSTSTGQTLTARVGLVSINMDIKVAAGSQAAASNWLQALGSAVVGHSVSTTQAFIALSILVMLIIIEGGIMYAAVSNSIISLGRNPFARKTIMRGFSHIVVLVAIVLLIGIGAIYLVLFV